MTRPKKPELKFATAPKPATAKRNKKAAATVETAAAKPTTSFLVVTTHSSTSTLVEISDLLDHLPLQAVSS
jgi:hypothetical protein